MPSRRVLFSLLVILCLHPAFGETAPWQDGVILSVDVSSAYTDVAIAVAVSETLYVCRPFDTSVLGAISSGLANKKYNYVGVNSRDVRAGAAAKMAFFSNGTAKLLSEGGKQYACEVVSQRYYHSQTSPQQAQTLAASTLAPPQNNSVARPAARNAGASQTATLHGRVSSVMCYGGVCHGEFNGEARTPNGVSYNVSGTLDNDGNLEGTLLKDGTFVTTIRQQLSNVSGLVTANGQVVEINGQIVVPSSNDPTVLKEAEPEARRPTLQYNVATSTGELASGARVLLLQNFGFVELEALDASQRDTNGSRIYSLPGKASTVRARSSRPAFLVPTDLAHELELYQLEVADDSRFMVFFVKNQRVAFPTAITVEAVSDGVSRVSPSADLAPGEYVLTPKSSNKSFVFGID